MNRRFLIHGAVVCAAAVCVPFTHAQKNSELKGKATGAIEKGLAYLTKQQKPDGFWSSNEYPGLTALIVQAYIGAPDGKGGSEEAAKKAMDFIRKNAKPDGGIYAKAMGNYNTSICLAALLRGGNSSDQKIIDAAHDYLVKGQTKSAANPALNGGFGYEAGGGRGGADLDNTVFTIEALKMYRDKNKGRENPEAPDLNWQAAIDFVSRCQQLPSHNKEPWVSKSDDEKGGFVYTPAQDNNRGPAGEAPSRAYGTMTYAGLMSFVYADMKPSDPRIVAALDWIAKHYTLEENPGQGAQGLYYYYHMMAKGLTIAGKDDLQAKGKKVDWRADLTQKILSLQKPDGSWSSENGRWMEKDPNLVTAYCLLALEHLQPKL